MGSTFNVSEAVDVLVYSCSGESFMVSVIRKVWPGKVRVDRRLARTRPLPPIDVYPPGVDRDLWRALKGLEMVCNEQHERWLDQRERERSGDV